MLVKSWSGARVVFARSGSPQHPHMQNHDFRLAPFGAPQSGFQRIERVVGAQRHKNVAGPDADIFQGEFAFLGEIEFIELGVGFGFLFGDLF